MLKHLVVTRSCTGRGCANEGTPKSQRLEIHTWLSFIHLPVTQNQKCNSLQFSRVVDRFTFVIYLGWAYPKTRGTACLDNKQQSRNFPVWYPNSPYRGISLKHLPASLASGSRTIRTDGHNGCCAKTAHSCLSFIPLFLSSRKQYGN